MLSAGALERAGLQPPGRSGPLLRLSVFLLKQRPDFCPGGVTHVTQQSCSQAWLLTADPDAPRDSPRSWCLPRPLSGGSQALSLSPLSSSLLVDRGAVSQPVQRWEITAEMEPPLLASDQPASPSGNGRMGGWPQAFSPPLLWLPPWQQQAHSSQVTDASETAHLATGCSALRMTPA